MMILLKTITIIASIFIILGLIIAPFIPAITNFALRSGYAIKDIKKYNIVYRISNIILGVICGIITYFMYLDKLPLYSILIFLLITEFIQSFIGDKFIVEVETLKNINHQENSLEKEIGLDEILNEDFFDKKEKENEKIKIIDDLIKEGLEIGVLKNTIFDKNNE